jgi:hypothetical protein
LPSDLREWVPEDDLAHFIIEAVERVGLGAFKVYWSYCRILVTVGVGRRLEAVA